MSLKRKIDFLIHNVFFDQYTSSLECFVLQSTSFENGGGLDEALDFYFWAVNNYSILLL